MLRLVLPALLLPLLAACTYERVSNAPPAYSSASPYGQSRHVQAPAQAIVPAPGSYCEEAVSEAQDAAARAAYSGTARETGRAERTAQYARRDCR